MNLDSLAPELQEKIRACETTEDLKKLAESEGTELTDEQLEAVTGGVDWSCPTDCPSHNCPRNN